MNNSQQPTDAQTPTVLGNDLIQSLRARVLSGELTTEQAFTLYTNFDGDLPVEDPDAEAPDWGTAEVLSWEYRDGEAIRTIQIPWQPTAWKSSVVRGQIVTEPVKPAFIKNLEALYRKQKDRKLAVSTMVAAAREYMIKTMPRVECHALRGNIVLTSRLPWQAMVDTGEFIYVSSKYVAKTKVKWDFDGDSIALAQNSHMPEERLGFKDLPGLSFTGRPVVPIKNPITRDITRAFLVDKVILDSIGPERLWDFTQTEKEAWLEHDAQLRAKELKARGNQSEAEQIFRKAHTLPNVGILDSLVKNWWIQSLEHEPLARKQELLYTGDVAYYVLEDMALGAARKDHTIGTDASSQALEMVTSNPRRVPGPMKPFLTNTGSCGTMRAEATAFVWRLNMPELLRRVAELDIPSFIRPSQRPRSSEPMNLPTAHHVVENLVAARIIEVHPLPRAVHTSDDIPLPVRIILRHGAQPVALTDVRKAQGVVEGLTYSFILPPVWDVEEECWHDPITHMAKCAQPLWQRVDDEDRLVEGFDARIMFEGQDEDGGISLQYARWWLETTGGAPKGHEFWQNKPASNFKRGRFQEWLSAYVGRYGLVVPTISPTLEIPELNRLVASNTVVVDYGHCEYDVDFWWAAFQCIPPVLCPSSKGDDRRVRKHVFNAAVGEVHPWWCPTDVNARRAGQMLSQFSRAHKPMEMVVAITLPTPRTGNVSVADWSEANQVQITSPGIAKQMLDGELGETVFYDRVTHKPEEGFDNLVQFQTVAGERRCAWLKKAKSSKDVGKLLDAMGGKFMPMPTLGFKEAWYETTELQPQVMAHGAEVKVLIGYTQSKGQSIPQHKVYTIAPDADLSADRIKVLDSVGTVGYLPADQCTKPVPVRVRHDIDLLYPVQELSDKGLLVHYMKNAVQRVVTLGDGRQVACWVTTITHYRTSTPTENMRTRMVRHRVRGLDAHTVIGGAQKAGIKTCQVRNPLNGALETITPFSIQIPNLDYAESIKNGIAQIMTQLGFAELLPSDMEQTFEEYVASTRVRSTQGISGAEREALLASMQQGRARI